MTRETWTAVDEYFTDLLVQPDAALTGALARSEEAGLPSIAVAPNQGKLLHLLARLQGARRILEIGTLGGYSTIWLARALPESGKLITLEASHEHAAVARENIDAAGLSDVVEVRVGNAVEALPRLADEGGAPFDVVFIDADKPNNPTYVTWAMRLTRPGSLIILDNVVRDGRVIDPAGGGDVVGVRDSLDLLAGDPRLSVTAIQTVGSKGYDGLAIALVVEGE
jgi:predicted O-methyltransferase YrrM